MSRKVIALRGRGGSGKTTTILNLHKLFRRNGWNFTEDIFNPETGDVVDVLTKGDKKFGITSCGDTDHILRHEFGRIQTYNPPLIACACRTYGGTNDFLEERFPDNVIYIEKTVEADGAKHDSANKKDVQILFDRILSELQ